MSKYVAVFVGPMSTRNVPAYRRLVRKFGPVFRKLGVIEYKEYLAADLQRKHGMVPFPRRIKSSRGETLLFAVLGFRSKSHCKQVMKRFEKYPWPDMDKMMKLLDHKRMVYGEFSLLIKA